MKSPQQYPHFRVHFAQVLFAILLQSGCKGQLVGAPLPANADTSGGSTTVGATGNGAGGNTQSGGTSAQGGLAPGGTPCINADCVALHSDAYTCVNDRCVALVSNDCPLVIPSNALELLKKPAPIILGGFASVTDAVHDTVATVNWNMAFQEFNDSTLGLPSYDGTGQRRPLVGLICQGAVTSTDPIKSAMRHLALDLKVPGILTTLSADDLLAAYDYTTSAEYKTSGGKPVFFMSTGSADIRLATLDDQGLVWHMLDDPRTLAATMAALVTRVMPAVQAARQASFLATGVDDPSKDSKLRVTLITSDDPTMVDISNVMTSGSTDHPEALLSINGDLATSSANSGYFHKATIESIDNHNSPDVSQGVDEIFTNPPHIIIAMATSEFAGQMLGPIELGWDSSTAVSKGRMRPFYLMSHLIYEKPELKAMLSGSANTAYQFDKRIVGVNYAQAQDERSKRLYDSYLFDLQSFYGTGPLYNGLFCCENMYDGAYHLLYSVAAAAVNRNSLDGAAILEALTTKVINTGAPYVEIGPSNISTTISDYDQIDAGYAMALWGTMGPPSFDTVSGTRRSTTSVWCMEYDTTLATPAWVTRADGLLYEPATRTFAPPANGAPVCLKNY